MKLKQFKKFLALLVNNGLFNGITILRRFFLWNYKKYFTKQRYMLLKFDKFDIYVDLYTKGISHVLAIVGEREKLHKKLLVNELKNARVVMDLGANIGYYTLIEASILGKRGIIYAIEPDPKNYKLLIKNIKYNGYSNIVKPFQIAISDKKGTAKFFIGRFSNVGTLNPIDYRTGKRLSNLSDKSILVKTDSFDNFVLDKEPIDLVRMDIEGHEVEVLKGIIRYIKKTNFNLKILFEAHPSKYDDDKHNMKDVLINLFALGFEIKAIITNVPNEDFLMREYVPKNIIFTDGVNRGLYTNISKEDLIDFICNKGKIRAVLIER